jgi:hypothetical protein
MILMSYDTLDKVNIFRKLNRSDTYDSVVYHHESENITNIKIRPQQGRIINIIVKHLCLSYTVKLFR